MKKLTQPHIQTALAGLVNAVLAALVFAGQLSTDAVGVWLVIFAASAGLLSAWYSPSVDSFGVTE
jgi:hypothetical protein